VIPGTLRDSVGFAEDVVVDDRVEFLVGLVRDRAFVLPAVRSVFSMR
jgi:hypothetical protein